MNKYIIAALLFFSGFCSAYTKVGFGYAFHQPKIVFYHFDCCGQVKYDMDFIDLTAHIETGFEYKKLSYGLHYALGKGNRVDPSKVELFIDYKAISYRDYHFKVGTGYKLLYEKMIDCTTHKEAFAHDERWDYSARFGLYKTLKKGYEIGVWHHSQWSVGEPYNDSWEYFKTELTISKTF